MRLLLAALLALWLSPAQAASIVSRTGRVAPITSLPFGAVGARTEFNAELTSHLSELTGILAPPVASPEISLAPVVQYLQQNVAAEGTPVQVAARQALIEALAKPKDAAQIASQLDAGSASQLREIVAALDQAPDKDRKQFSKALKGLRKEFSAEGALQGKLDKLFDGSEKKGSVDLEALDPDATPGFPKKSKKKGEDLLEQELEKLKELQAKLYASKKGSILIVLQAMDTAGKDGTIKHVLQLNPQGVVVTPFKKPTAEEAAHDFLWRIQQHNPANGMIQVFNRSHYEDILVPSVYKLLPKDKLDARYDAVNNFEKYLSEQGVTVLKFYLNISKDEQKERLEARLEDPRKHWKFDPNDLEARKHWKQFMKTYGKILARTNTKHAPWYVIPANKKWYRNYAIARILRETMEAMALDYPAPPPDLKKYKVD